MPDIKTPEARSYNMSRIRGIDTKPEMLVRRYLFSQGFRYRLHDKRLPGKPDIVLPKYQTVVFVNGCFWHGHQGCKYFVIPETRQDFWVKKISKTAEDDFRNEEILKSAGYQVIVIWECELRKKSERSLTFQKLKESILDNIDQESKVRK